MNKDLKLAVADDHKLMRKALVQMLQNLGYRILTEGDNGQQLIDKLEGRKPDIVLMDVSMPIMDGVETTKWFRKHLPDTGVIALSMDNDEFTIIRMIRAGAKGYLLKDTDPMELQRAISDVYEKGFYYSELISGPLVYTLSHPNEKLNERKGAPLTDKEITFLKYVCSDLSYREIAEMMNLSVRTIDGYRDELFNRLRVKSRIGLVLYAIRNKIFIP